VVIVKTHVELDGSGQPLVTRSVVCASAAFRIALVVCFFFASILFGLLNAEYFLQALAPRVLSYVFGFITSLIASVFAVIIALFIPHRYEFMQDVFCLYQHNDFRMAVTFVFLLMVISRPVVRILDRVFVSYSSRHRAFIILSLSGFGMMLTILSYLSENEQWFAYVFSFFVVGVIYLLFHVQIPGKSKKTYSTRHTPYDLNLKEPLHRQGQPSHRRK